jgi:cell fate regulator YaaT (PSP1 superfamily)
MQDTLPEEKKPAVKDEPQKKTLVVGIQYRPAGKIYTFETTERELARGDCVIVEAEYGTSMGMVIVPPREVSDSDLPSGLKKVVKRASEEEKREQLARNERALEIFKLFCRKIKEHNLPMKPLDAELADGGRKIIFTFFAEERIDFRSLVKELASELHMRIEMRQIGARDEVKCMGGTGTCGLVTCCFLHLRQFQSISIQMAKTQGLTPNPAKLTGICGKLKCCLAYENSAYAEIRQRLPRIGMFVSTPKGDGKIVDLDILNEQCVVRIGEGIEVRVPAKDIRPQTEKAKETIEEAKPSPPPEEKTKEVKGGEKRRKKRRDTDRNK